VKALALVLLLALAAPAGSQEPAPPPPETAQQTITEPSESVGIRKDAGTAVDELKPAAQPPSPEIEIDCGMQSGVKNAEHAVEHIPRRQRGRVYDLLQTRF
jgi:hypothetical protein